jgi:hypothetical protein
VAGGAVDEGRAVGKSGTLRPAKMTSQCDSTRARLRKGRGEWEVGSLAEGPLEPLASQEEQSSKVDALYKCGVTLAFNG